MLLAVEGGGFFSASSSGYSKCLSLLVLGRKDEDRPMRVLPWSQCEFVEQETNNFQLASRKKQASHRCPFFVCFGSPSATLDGKSPPKVGPMQSESLLGPSTSEKGRDPTTSDASEETSRKILLKSILKKNHTACAIMDEYQDAKEGHDEQSDIIGNGGRRKIQWRDDYGRELVDIKEFEPSEVADTEDESEKDGYRRCDCTIQ